MLTRNRLRSRLLPFLLLSFCGHVALALPWLPGFRVTGQQQTVLSVTLDAADRSPSPAAATDARTTRAASSKTNQSKAKQPIITSATRDSAQAEIPTQSQSHREPSSAATANAASTGPQHETARAQVKAQLLADLRRYFEYPPLARRQGWQGTVWLSITIEPGGALERVQLTKTSGYHALDRSAVDSMQRIGRLPEAKHLLNGRPLEFSISVVYNLSDS